MRLKEIVIKTSQLWQLKSFYGSVLQLNVISNEESAFSLKFGESYLRIEETKSGNPFYHFAINIPANKIEEARLWLRNKVELIWMEDYKSEIADFRNWHAKSVYFFDPGGNIVELIARFDLANPSAEEFTSDHFLSISEIGLVFPENQIQEQVDKLKKQSGLNYFLKQPPMEQFKVLGDDEGLFIIVTENRNWYPTTKPSGIFPLEITMENEAVKNVLRY